MTVYVDADACPVKSITLELCKQYDVTLVMVMDFSHEYNDGYSNVITVDKGIDSADFKILNLIKKGDLCITQDIGLCSMVLAKNAYCLHNNGFFIDNSNIDELLFKRHINKEIRKTSKKFSKIQKRTQQNDDKFQEKLNEYLLKFATN